MEDEFVVDLIDLVNNSEELEEVNRLLLHLPNQEMGLELVVELLVTSVKVFDLFCDFVDLGLREVASLVQEDEHDDEFDLAVGVAHGQIEEGVVDVIEQLDSNAFVLEGELNAIDVPNDK